MKSCISIRKGKSEEKKINYQVKNIVTVIVRSKHIFMSKL